MSDNDYLVCKSYCIIEYILFLMQFKSAISYSMAKAALSHFTKCLAQGKFNSLDPIYYPPELSSIRYCCLGVFRKEYLRLVTKQCK